MLNHYICVEQELDKLVVLMQTLLQAFGQYICAYIQVVTRVKALHVHVHS